MATKRIDQVLKTNVFIGRFQPFHKGHMAAAKKGLENDAILCILVGSTNKRRSYKNPFTFKERRKMILSNFTDPYDRARVHVLPIKDQDSDPKWVKHVHKTLNDYWTPRKFTLLTPRKEDTYYLDLFPDFDRIEIKVRKDVTGESIRRVYFEIPNCWLWNHMCPMGTIDFLIEHQKTKTFEKVHYSLYDKDGNQRKVQWK
jgi:bifunctional NMN adenylyltransferase/nudix hydrolase